MRKPFDCYDNLDSLVADYPDLVIPEEPYDYISSETYRSRRNLIATTAISIVLLLTNAEVNSFSFWGVHLKSLKTEHLYLIMFIVASYEFIMFSARLKHDVRVWNSITPKFKIQVVAGMGSEYKESCSLYNILNMLNNFLVAADEKKESPQCINDYKHLNDTIPEIQAMLKSDMLIRVKNKNRQRRFISLFEKFVPISMYCIFLILLLYKVDALTYFLTWFGCTTVPKIAR